MKHLLFILLPLALSLHLPAQTVTDTQLKIYIKQNGYVPITDKAKLPKALMPWYKELMDTINAKHPDLRYFYVHNSTVSKSKQFLSIIIYPINGIKLLLVQANKDERNRRTDSIRADTIIRVNGVATKVKMQTIDDFGGSVGELLLKINKANHQITVWSFQ